MWKTLHTLTAMRKTMSGMENITSKIQLPTMSAGKKLRKEEHTASPLNSTPTSTLREILEEVIVILSITDPSINCILLGYSC